MAIARKSEGTSSVGSVVFSADRGGSKRWLLEAEGKGVFEDIGTDDSCDMVSVG